MRAKHNSSPSSRKSKHLCSRKSKHLCSWPSWKPHNSIPADLQRTLQRTIWPALALSPLVAATPGVQQPKQQSKQQQELPLQAPQQLGQPMHSSWQGLKRAPNWQPAPRWHRSKSRSSPSLWTLLPIRLLRCALLGSHAHHRHSQAQVVDRSLVCVSGLCAHDDVHSAYNQIPYHRRSDRGKSKHLTHHGL